ncbi:MAG TPA: chitinase [Pseudonocardiaceae bacterium]|jgi:chitinase|nr:chitinase [Pseudonocardiaceae bacterium]
MRLRPLLAAAAAVIAGAALAGTASAAPLDQLHQHLLPHHLFAPYFESYNTGDDPSVFAAESGSKYLTMAFVQTATPGSCTIDWNGTPSTPIAFAQYGKQILDIRAHGGDVIPSFGGYAADHGGTEIADSCTDVNQIAAAYESVITTYGVTRLDLDTEDASLTNTAGIDRRNKAIALVERWAAGHHRTVQFSYTLPTFSTGLTANGLAVLQSAVANHARVDVVNIMTFDYYDGLPHEMATDTESAAAGVVAQLKTLYPHRSTHQLYGMLGITEMVGIDDYGPSETFTTADAVTVANWAEHSGLSLLSFWAIERDNGSCVGTKGAGSCSGVAQSDWYFSHTFEPFTHR